MAGWLGAWAVFALLGRRNFALLWVGHTVSILGDYIFFIAITYWVFARTGSSLATGAVLVCSAFPLMLFAPVAGRVVDRYDRRRVMLLAEGARGLLFLLALAVILRYPDALWPIDVVSFAQSALAAFYWPARGAMLPQLAPGKSLAPANALYQFTDGVVRVVAPTLAALTLSRLSAVGVVALDAATFAISAGCIVALPSSPSVAVAAPSLVSAAPQFHDVHPPATRYPHVDQPHRMRRQERMAQADAPDEEPRGAADFTSGGTGDRAGALFAVGAVIGFANATLGVLLPIFVRTSLRDGAWAYSWLFTAQALGDIAMSMWLGRRAQGARFAGRRRALVPLAPIASALIGVGVALIAIAAIPTLLFALVFSLLFGALTSFAATQALTALQRGAPGAQVGRRLARYTAAQACAQLSGLALVSVVAMRLDAGWLIAFDGTMAVMCGGIVWGMLAPGAMFHMKH